MLTLIIAASRWPDLGSGVDIGDGMGGGVIAGPAPGGGAPVLLALHQSHNVLVCHVIYLNSDKLPYKYGQKSREGTFQFRPLLGTTHGRYTGLTRMLVSDEPYDPCDACAPRS
jgi:hypothetical protein